MYTEEMERKRLELGTEFFKECAEGLAQLIVDCGMESHKEVVDFLLSDEEYTYEIPKALLLGVLGAAGACISSGVCGKGGG